MKIIWTKWQDPLAHLVRGKSNGQEEPADLAARAARDAWLPEDGVVASPARPRRGVAAPFLVGPNGAIPVTEETLPSRAFKLWVGHTDFPVTHAVAQKISRVPGVETLDVHTRYRFRLGVGKAFESRAVRRDVELACRGLDGVATYLASHHEAWAIHVLPRGQVMVAHGRDREEVATKAEAYSASAAEAYTSW